MRTRTVETYTLAELKDAHPDGYARVVARWRDGCGTDIPWSDETMDSMKAVVKACGGVLHDWSIGAHDPRSFIRVSVDDNFIVDEESDDSAEIQKDAQWYFDNVLKALGYTQSNVIPCGIEFPGLCPLTGYCADDAFLESVWKSLTRGDTLSEALESLADDARRMMEDELEQWESEESMFANWGELEFTADGSEF